MRDYEFILQNVKALIFYYQLIPEPKFTFVNDAATEIVGYTPEEHYNNPFLGRKLVYEKDLEKLDQIMQDENYDFSKPIILRWIHKNGSILWTEQLLNPDYKDGKIIGMTGIARDITRYKRFEELLHYHIPLCAWCDKIRDEDGNWVDAGDFIQSLDETVSHGICPDCSDKLQS